MRDRVLREAGGVALVLGSILIAVALLSHSPMDPSPFHASTERVSPANWAGWLGATLSAALLNLIGLTALLLPAIGAVLGWRILRQRPLESPSLALIGWLVVVLALPGLVALVAFDIPTGAEWSPAPASWAGQRRPPRRFRRPGRPDGDPGLLLIDRRALVSGGRRQRSPRPSPRACRTVSRAANGSGCARSASGSSSRTGARSSSGSSLASTTRAPTAVH
jgi:hypothetical protein